MAFHSHVIGNSEGPKLEKLLIETREWRPPPLRFRWPHRNPQFQFTIPKDWNETTKKCVLLVTCRGSFL